MANPELTQPCLCSRRPCATCTAWATTSWTLAQAMSECLWMEICACSCSCSCIAHSNHQVLTPGQSTVAAALLCMLQAAHNQLVSLAFCKPQTGLKCGPLCVQRPTRKCPPAMGSLPALSWQPLWQTLTIGSGHLLLAKTSRQHNCLTPAHQHQICESSH